MFRKIFDKLCHTYKHSDLNFDKQKKDDDECMKVKALSTLCLDEERYRSDFFFSAHANRIGELSFKQTITFPTMNCLIVVQSSEKILELSIQST